jgi:hypothetical protein
MYVEVRVCVFSAPLGGSEGMSYVELLVDQNVQKDIIKNRNLRFVVFLTANSHSRETPKNATKQLRKFRR